MYVMVSKFLELLNVVDKGKNPRNVAFRLIYVMYVITKRASQVLEQPSPPLSPNKEIIGIIIITTTIISVIMWRRGLMPIFGRLLPPFEDD